MMLFFFVFLGLAVGYAIPVLSALLFSMAAGSFAAGQVALQGRIRPRFIVAYTLLWTVSSFGAGFIAASIAGVQPWAVCAGVGTLLLLLLWSDVNDSKRRLPVVQILGMSFGTAVGTLLGYEAVVRSR